MGQEASQLVRRERCPVCASRGLDSAGDNLAVYNDGHKYCYSCQHLEKASLRYRLSRMIASAANFKADDPTVTVQLPPDSTSSLPHNVLLWLRKYQISDYEISRYKFLWSNNLNRLIFPVYDDKGTLLMWQGRYFGNVPSAPKYLTTGPSSDIMYCVGAKIEGSIAIVTEDLLSAIKVGRSFVGVPLWGSNLSFKMLRKLKVRFSMVGIWLDPDKRRESLKTAIWASQHIPCFSIFSGKDPKEYMSSEITEFVDIASRSMITKLDTEDENST